MTTTVPTAVVNFKKVVLTTAHVTAYNSLAGQSTPQTVAQMATSLGLDQGKTEEQMSLLVDEALAKRTSGPRATATYSLV